MKEIFPHREEGVEAPKIEKMDDETVGPPKKSGMPSKLRRLAGTAALLGTAAFHSEAAYGQEKMTNDSLRSTVEHTLEVDQKKEVQAFRKKMLEKWLADAIEDDDFLQGATVVENHIQIDMQGLGLGHETVEVKLKDGHIQYFKSRHALFSIAEFMREMSDLADHFRPHSN